jgi:hypothetical protein
MVVDHGQDLDHDTISGLSERTPCALIHKVGGYRSEVTWGQVYPRLPFPPNDEIMKLGEAVLQRIQWL